MMAAVIIRRLRGSFGKLREAISRDPLFARLSLGLYATALVDYFLLGYASFYEVSDDLSGIIPRYLAYVQDVARFGRVDWYPYEGHGIDALANLLIPGSPIGYLISPLTPYASISVFVLVWVTLQFLLSYRLFRYFGASEYISLAMTLVYAAANQPNMAAILSPALFPGLLYLFLRISEASALTLGNVTALLVGNFVYAYFGNPVTAATGTFAVLAFVALAYSRLLSPAFLLQTVFMGLAFGTLHFDFLLSLISVAPFSVRHPVMYTDNLIYLATRPEFIFYAATLAFGFIFARPALSGRILRVGCLPLAMLVLFYAYYAILGMKGLANFGVVKFLVGLNLKIDIYFRLMTTGSLCILLQSLLTFYSKVENPDLYRFVLVTSVVRSLSFKRLALALGWAIPVSCAGYAHLANASLWLSDGSQKLFLDNAALQALAKTAGPNERVATITVESSRRNLAPGLPPTYRLETAGGYMTLQTKWQSDYWNSLNLPVYEQMAKEAPGSAFVDMAEQAAVKVKRRLSLSYPNVNFKAYEVPLNAFNTNLLALSGVRYLVSPYKIVGSELRQIYVYDDSVLRASFIDRLRRRFEENITGKADLFVYDLGWTFPRAFAVHGLKFFEDAKSLLAALRSASRCELARAAFVEKGEAETEEVAPAPLTQGDDACGETQPGVQAVSVERTGGASYRFQIPASSHSRIIVTSMSYSPFWTCQADSASCLVFRADAAFVGVQLEENVKQFELRYLSARERLRRCDLAKQTCS